MTVYRAIGLMSGTSLDGIDAALCRIDLPSEGPLTGTEIDVEAFRTDEYERSFRQYLRERCAETTRLEAVARADVAVGERFAAAVDRLLAESGTSPAEVDLIGSHGQTARHAPALEELPGGLGKSRATLQLGDGNVIAGETGIDTVSDVRAGDVAVGGHGAPLSPLLDWLQFGSPDEDRIVQNVGGIGNCSVLPRGADRSGVTAFDTGPGNMVVDAVVEAVTDGDLQYDADGRMAARGSVDEELLAALLDDPYFHRSPPKSTGRERFGDDYATDLLERARERGAGDADAVATATALTAESIADAYERHASIDPDRVVVSGGGAKNDTLLSMLRERLACPVEGSDARGVDPDAREAVLLALLAVLFDADRPGNLPSVTGAERPVVLGKRSSGTRFERD